MINPQRNITQFPVPLSSKECFYFIFLFFCIFQLFVLVLGCTYLLLSHILLAILICIVFGSSRLKSSEKTHRTLPAAQHQAAIICQCCVYSLLHCLQVAKKKSKECRFEYFKYCNRIICHLLVLYRIVKISFLLFEVVFNLSTV